MVVQKVNGDFTSLSNFFEIQPHCLANKVQGRQETPSRYFDYTNQEKLFNHAGLNLLFLLPSFDWGNIKSPVRFPFYYIVFSLIRALFKIRK